MQRQTTDFKKIFAIHISDKGLISSIYRDLQLKKKKPNLEVVKDMNRFFTKKIYKWPISQMSVFGEMHIKTKMRYNYTSTSMAKIRKIENP